MRKIVSLLSVLMLFCLLAFGQTRTVTGVIRDAQGRPIPFATITESGTTNATTADENGNFTIKVGQNSRLTISSSGFASRTVTPTDGNQTIALTANENLQEVVVTALGIRRKPEEIGYATSTVRPEQITAGRNFNLTQSLSGKVSGLTIVNSSGSVNAAPQIQLRGLRSLTGNNSPLIVLDGVQVPASTINIINPNDVERVDVLKGGQAATLFGSEGVNGAVIITTKKGSQRPEITLQHTNNVETVSFLPKFNQNFGSGSAYGANQAENFHPAENQQYGDRYDGSIRPVGRMRSDGSTLLAPYSYDPGSREIWNTGNTGQTDFSYRAGDANSNFFASYQNLYSKGIVPGDKYNRNSLRLNAGRTYGKVNLSFDANYVWDHADRTNTDFYFYALNSPSWVPLNDLKDWRNNKFAEMSGYFNDYYNSPWWYLDNQRFETRQNVLNTNLKLSFKPIASLEITGRVALTNRDNVTSTYSNPYVFSQFARTQAPVDYFNNNYDRFLTGLGRFVARTPLVGGVGESTLGNRRITGDLFATWTKAFGDIDLKTIVGTQAIDIYQKTTAVSTNGIGQADLFNLDNSATGLFSGSNGIARQRKIAGFIDVTAGFKKFLYIHGTYRNDYTSLFYSPTLGFNNPKFATYGADVSLIVSDIVPSIKGNVVDALKIRASYNRNGNDNLNPYGLQTIFPNATGFPFSGLIGATVGNTLVDPGLTPENVKTAEVGMEISFLRNRLNFEASYYNQKSDRQILDINTSFTIGYPTYRLNAADVTNKGFEFDLRANVLRNRDWNININANYSNNKNVVNTLYGNTGLNSLNYGSVTARYSTSAELGQMFPYLKTSVFERDSLGRVIVDETDGWPLRATDKVGQGTTTPIHVMGLGVNVAWKGFTFVTNAEYRGGHVIYNQIGEDMSFTGSSAVTTVYDRETFIWPNSVYRDATGKIQENRNIAVGAYQAMYQGFGDGGFSRGFSGVGELFVSSGAFWKIREMSLSYDLPASILGRVKFIRGLTLTAFARNPFVWVPADNQYTDPEFGNGVNSTLNTPPVRQFGGVIKVVF